MFSIRIAANYIPGTAILTGDWDRSGHLQIVYDDDNPNEPLVEAEIQPDFPFPLQLTGGWQFQPFGQLHGAPTPYIADDDTIENADRYAITTVNLESYQTAENVWLMLEHVHNAIKDAAPNLEYDANQNSNSYVRTALHTVGIDLGAYLAAVTPADVRNFPGAETNILLGSRQNSVENVPINLNLSGENAGTSGADFIRTGIGNDTIEGRGGDDVITAGRGDDTLMGGTGFDTYNIAQSGDGVDTITDEDGRGQIIITSGVNQSLFSISGNATPVNGGTEGNQLYSIASNNIKLEYSSTSKVLNVIDWNGKGSSGNIIINDFDSGDLNIFLEEKIITAPDPDPDPIPPTDPTTDGGPNSLLSVQAIDQTINVNEAIPLIRLFPLDKWIDNDGINDIVAFSVADRTPGGGFLKANNVQATAGKVYEFPITDIINWYFVGGATAAVDEIGFNVIQTNGDYSPRLEPGAIITTVEPNDPVPDPDPTPGTGPAPTGGGSNLAALSFASTSTGASSGGEIEVIYTVKNIGDKRSARGEADIVLADDPNLQNGRKVGDDFSIPELNPGEERTYKRTVDVPISENGDFYLGIDVRSVSLGHNRIESDDTASISFKIAPGLSGDPDLNPGLTDPKKIFSQGVAETINFSISTNNNGAPPYDYQVLLSRDDVASSDDIFLIDKKSSSGLGFSGTHRYQDIKVVIPSYISDGLYHLIVVADPFSKISETKENNNTADRQIVVASRAADSNDLSNIVGSHVVVESDVMQVMQPYKFEFYGFMDSIDDPVDASEDGPLIPLKDKLYLSEDNIFDKNDIPIRSGSELIQQPLGQIIRDGVTFSLPQWIESGDYYLFTAFDTDNEIAEDFESDNVTKGTNVTIVNNITRTVLAGDDTITVIEGETHSENILLNDVASNNQEMSVQRFEGDLVGSSSPLVGQTKSGLSYSISRDGQLNLDTSTLYYDLQPGEIKTETFRYELRSTTDDTADLGVVTITIRDPDTIINQPENIIPIGKDDGTTNFSIGFETDENTTFTTANVLANDSDGDGDQLSVTVIDTTVIQGLVTSNGDGTFNYDPNGAFSYLEVGETAIDSFSYAVSDKKGGIDTATVFITINGVSDAPVHNQILGTEASDYLVGTDAADIIHSQGGGYDRSAGGLGADIFAFGAEALNGVRERDVIMDYEVGIDAILLEDGATVGSIRQTSTGTAIFLEGDFDAIYVQGEGVLPGNLTFVPENILLG